jgi:hypothetical protein
MGELPGEGIKKNVISWCLKESREEADPIEREWEYYKCAEMRNWKRQLQVCERLADEVRALPMIEVDVREPDSQQEI